VGVSLDCDFSNLVRLERFMTLSNDRVCVQPVKSICKKVIYITVAKDKHFYAAEAHNWMHPAAGKIYKN